MGYRSPPQFLTIHALRIKGLATMPSIARMTLLARSEVATQLRDLIAADHARYRSQRELWQLTPVGRAEHAVRLLADLAAAGVDDLARPYDEFLRLNSEFKALCGRWQLRDGAPNDHRDAGYDRGAIDSLSGLHDAVTLVLAELGGRLARFDSYSIRLRAALDRLEDGDASSFTGVMCGSYHDIWMELHEDLMLTQRIERSAESSHPPARGPLR